MAAADVEVELGLSHGRFGLMLSVALLGAAAANAVGGPVAERWGTARVLGGSLAAWGALQVAGATARGPLAFGAVLVAVFALGGLVDVAMNVAATAGLAHRPGALVRFHALFNGGAAIGAAAMAGVVGAGLTWRWMWVVAGTASIAMGWVCGRSNLPAGEAGDSPAIGDALALLRRERLGLLALAFAVGAMVEGGVELWGVLYLRRQLESGLLVGASSAVLGYAIATAARVLLGPTAGRRGPARGVAAGAGTAAVGIVVLGTAQTAWIAGGGLVLAAGGISMCWPLLLSHATAGRPRPGAVVGAVSAAGYSGFVLGPTIVGWLAAGAGLRAGLLLLAAASVFVAITPSLTGRRSDQATSD